MSKSPKFKYVVYVGANVQYSPSRIGWKAANLFNLGSSGIRVPASAVVSIDAFQALTKGHKSDEPAVREHAGRMKAAALPKLLRRELTGAWNWLASRRIQPFGISVRSSASEEDLPAASFAGQFETFLNVRSFDEFVASIREVWASASSDRVAAYMTQHNLPGRLPQMAVLIQPTIPADVSGVAFGCDPATRSKDVIHIEAVWGLGDILVGGRITPDVCKVNKASGDVQSYTAATKTIQSLCSGAPWPGTLEVPVPSSQINKPCLTSGQLHVLIRTLRKVEEVLKGTMDVEWCFRGKEMTILQARPVTT